MRIERLLSIVVYLLNRDLASASEMAQRFGVSVRTIQRDMEAIEGAGIPIYAQPGAYGGYGIVEGYKVDRQLLTMDDLYFILTALSGVEDVLQDQRVARTIEKIRTIAPSGSLELLAKRNEKLVIDFSLLGTEACRESVFQTVQKAVEQEYVVRLVYLNSHMEESNRVVEPLTIAFRWRSWYLYAWCRLREDYRLFRISRMREAEALPEHFHRRHMTYQEFVGEFHYSSGKFEIVVDFASEVRSQVEECFPKQACHVSPDGTLRVTARVPNDASFFQYLLSFGDQAVVVAPDHARETVATMAKSILNRYQLPE
ncbi:MAG: YafY family protein [Cyanobacteria bacterium J06627_8]